MIHKEKRKIISGWSLLRSGLINRDSEHTWNERRSQFSKVFETANQDIEMGRLRENVWSIIFSFFASLTSKHIISN